MNQSDVADALTRAHLWIQGQVQGVGYRASTCHHANQLNLNGWVRNLPNGQVEAVFEGPRSQVDEIVQWCYRGPTSAVVKNIEIEYEPPEGVRGFSVIR